MATNVNVGVPQVVAPHVLVSNSSNNPRGLDVKTVKGLGKKI